MPTRRTAIASALAMLAAPAIGAVPSPLFVAIRRARLADAAHRQAGRDTIAEAREADLSLCLGVERVQRLPTALPFGRLIAPVIDLRPVAASTQGRFARLLSRAGDVVAALVLVGGGVGLTGLASLL